VRGRSDALVTAVKPETILDYTRKLAALIGLGHWRIDFEVEPADEDSDASIRVISGQQRALLRIGKTYAGQTPEDKRATILHELIHIYLWPCSEAAEHAQPHLGTTAAALFTAQHDLTIERATDALAVAFAEHFPLPAGK
jgi:hypothetical protein